MPPFQGNSLMGQMPPMPPMPGLSGMSGMPPMMMPPMPPPPFPNSTTGQPLASDLTEEAELEIAALKRKVDMLNRELDREISNSKLFEKKCEEYLNQLQRSADIIESLRAKHELESENYENRIHTLTDAIKDQKEKNYDLEDSNQRLNEDLLHLKRETELDLHEKYEMKGQIDDNTRKNQYLEKDLNSREDKIQQHTEEISLLKKEIFGFEENMKILTQQNFDLAEEGRRKDSEISQLRYEEESWRKRGEENGGTVEGLHREVDLLKGERRGDWHKMEGRERECDELKNEIFMLKKFVVDIERRDMEIDN
jgi:chromosome segregation ATPase